MMYLFCVCANLVVLKRRVLYHTLLTTTHGEAGLQTIIAQWGGLRVIGAWEGV
jgi:hypothetical protein